MLPIRLVDKRVQSELGFPIEELTRSAGVVAADRVATSRAHVDDLRLFTEDGDLQLMIDRSGATLISYIELRELMRRSPTPA